jgi:hypothetical protein
MLGELDPTPKIFERKSEMKQRAAAFQGHCTLGYSIGNSQAELNLHLHFDPLFNLTRSFDCVSER